MYNLTYATSLTEFIATEIIMDACRSNPERSPYRTQGIPTSYNVLFYILSSGVEHEAIVRDANGFVVAIAIVDEYDN